MYCSQSLFRVPEKEGSVIRQKTYIGIPGEVVLRFVLLVGSIFVSFDILLSQLGIPSFPEIFDALGKQMTLLTTSLR